MKGTHYRQERIDGFTGAHVPRDDATHRPQGIVSCYHGGIHGRPPWSSARNSTYVFGLRNPTKSVYAILLKGGVVTERQDDRLKAREEPCLQPLPDDGALSGRQISG